MEYNIYYFKCAESEFSTHFVISIYLPLRLYEGWYQPFYQPVRHNGGSGSVGICPTIVSDTESLQMVGRIPTAPVLLQCQGGKIYANVAQKIHSEK